MLKKDLYKISVLELFESNQISKRAYTSCHNAQFNTVYDIILYYNQGSSFNNIRNSGRKTCEELISFCKNILSQTLDYENPELIPNEENERFESQFEFNASHYKLLQNKYSELINGYSVRVFNCLNKISVEKFIKTYLNCSIKELNAFKNIGEKSVNEIIDLRVKLITFIDLIKQSELTPELYIKLDAINKYGSLCENDFIIDFYIKTNHLPMLWILEQIISNNISKEFDILINTYRIFNTPSNSIAELASKHNLSKERVRQIRNNISFNTFSFPNNSKKNKFLNINNIFQHSTDWIYLIENLENNNIICSQSSDIQNYLINENCNFSSDFVLYIMANIFRDIYSFFGDIDVTNKSNNWANSFIIKNEYSEIFDFEKLRLEFSNILIDNDSEYFLDIEEYVANSLCWLNYDFNKNDNIISIVRYILLYEFHLYSDSIDGQIKIPANKERKPIDVLYEILQKTGNPMHINEIFEKFKIIFPEHKYTEASQLRPHLQRHDAITFRKRNSIYLLKEWRHIRAGTIRDAIVEFLLNKSLPQTAEDITKYVLQYFPETNVSSVRSSMQIDTQRRFSFYKNKLFGLISKEYPIGYEISEFPETQRKSFSQRIFDFEKFIIENDHFPFSSSNDKKEASLYRWWNLVLKGTTQISEEQKNIVERILLQYSEYETDKGVFEWNLNYNKLKCFILENSRLPSTIGNEKFLYGWLRRAKEDFQNNKLNEEQRQKFLNLAKLI